jgi:hypothetical protein
MLAEVARGATKQNPHGKYPVRDGVWFCVRKDERHVGEVMYRKLFRPAPGGLRVGVAEERVHAVDGLRPAGGVAVQPGLVTETVLNVVYQVSRDLREHLDDGLGGQRGPAPATGLIAGWR